MVCAMADANYAVVAPHQAQGPVSTAVCVQIGACTPNLLVQELFDEFNVGVGARDRGHRRWRSSMAGFRFPTAPGLGIDLNWTEIEKHPYQVSNFLPLFAPGWERREGERVSRPESAAAVDAADQTA